MIIVSNAPNSGFSLLTSVLCLSLAVKLQKVLEVAVYDICSFISVSFVNIFAGR